MNRIKRSTHQFKDWYKIQPDPIKAAIIGGLFVLIVGILTAIVALIIVFIQGFYQIKAAQIAKQTNNTPTVIIETTANLESQLRENTRTPIATVTVPTAATFTPCPGPADFTFEDGTPGNWGIRYDGTTPMGESLKYSNAVQCNGNPVDSLVFKFQLGTGHGAQVGLDGKGVPLAAGMSAWLYAPEGTPATLAVRCFVMESESRGYAWYETEPKPLSPGGWAKIDCPYSDFHWVKGGEDKGWQNPPQFIGFGFLDTQDKPYLGTIDITSIDIK